jgi:hypothetical protein
MKTRGTGRYIVADVGDDTTTWDHVFRVGGPGEICRWVYDRQTETLVYAEVAEFPNGEFGPEEWRPLNEAESDDLLRSLHDNQIERQYPDFGLAASDTAPGWAAGAAAGHSP